MTDHRLDQLLEVIRSQFGNNKYLPLHEPYFGGNEKEYLNQCIDSTFVSSVGAFVNRFEEEIAKSTQTEKGVAVVNGTAALQVALQLVGVKKGEEVITQALTFVATANAIAYNQAKPVFLDVDRDTMGLSPKALRFFLDEFGEKRQEGTFNKRTGARIGACVVMHTFGFPARIIELKEICDTWNIPIVEDSAEALGSSVKNKPLGGFGQLGVLSFNGNKIITSGGGGAIITNDPGLARKAKYLTTTAKVPHPYEYLHDELGYNFRMPNLNAALLCAQLEQLDVFLANKRELAIQYKEKFDRIGVNFRMEMPETTANYWLMCIELEDKQDRNAFLKLSNDSGVMTRPIWTLMNHLPMYSSCQHDGLANSLYLEERIVNIPSSVRP
jgi:perosamine synthetase